jgi:hypothetical protein
MAWAMFVDLNGSRPSWPASSSDRRVTPGLTLRTPSGFAPRSAARPQSMRRRSVRAAPTLLRSVIPAARSS